MAAALTTRRCYPGILSKNKGRRVGAQHKTAEADELARSLSRLTGESMTEAVTVALRERLARERAKREASTNMAARVAALAEQMRTAYDTRPVSCAEWDAAAGEAEPAQRLSGDGAGVIVHKSLTAPRQQTSR